MSAKINSLVTADNSARAARTIAPRFIEEQGSAANSSDARPISSPVSKKTDQSMHGQDKTNQVAEET